MPDNGLNDEDRDSPSYLDHNTPHRSTHSMPRNGPNGGARYEVRNDPGDRLNYEPDNGAGDGPSNGPDHCGGHSTHHNPDYEPHHSTRPGFAIPRSRAGHLTHCRNRRSHRLVSRCSVQRSAGPETMNVEQYWTGQSSPHPAETIVSKS